MVETGKKLNKTLRTRRTTARPSTVFVQAVKLILLWKSINSINLFESIFQSVFFVSQVAKSIGFNATAVATVGFTCTASVWTGLKSPKRMIIYAVIAKTENKM